MARRARAQAIARALVQRLVFLLGEIVLLDGMNRLMGSQLFANFVSLVICCFLLVFGFLSLRRFRRILLWNEFLAFLRFFLAVVWRLGIRFVLAGFERIKLGRSELSTMAGCRLRGR